MIRDALKDALKDLRGQLRGRKASAYVMKIEEEHDDKETSAKDDDVKDKPKRSGASAGNEAVSEGMEELRAQMKTFMSGAKNKGAKGRPIMPLPPTMKKASAPKIEVEIEVTKPKGKTK